MVWFRQCLYPAAGLMAVLALACRGGGDERERALQSVSENDLAIMVLAREELGAEFADLEIDGDESGFRDNNGEADATIDPEDTVEDLEAAGRTNGYGLGYSDPDFSALEEGKGVVFVGTSFDLFTDAEAASAFLEKQVADFRRFEGEEVEPGFTLEEVSTFEVSGLAEEAIGVTARARFGEVVAYQTAVGFTLGRLMGAAELTRADDVNVTPRVEEIARALEERVTRVLLGEITGTPVPLPEKEKEKEAAPAPEGGPDLAAMALSLEDLPAGASIDREGYVKDEDTVASYEREFDLGLVEIGNSQLIGLENDVDLYTNALEASSIFTASEAIFTGESASDFFASFFEEGAGFGATNLLVEAVPISDLGDDSFGVRVSYDTPAGPFENLFVVVRVERALGWLIITGQPGKMAIEDIAPLEEALTARMEAVLAAGP